MTNCKQLKTTFSLAFAILFLSTFSAFSQNKKEAKIGEPFDFNAPFHSLGFSVFSGINFAPKLQGHSGEIKPVLYNSYVPEFTIHYNFVIKNGFGVSLEVPFGLFSRKSLTKLSDFGASNDVLLGMGSLYVGFTGKLTVFKELGDKVCMQGELGFKFNPFYHSANKWHNVNYYELQQVDVEEDNSSINFPMVEQKYYAVPDATGAILFFFHGKRKPKQNFVIGVHANLSFVKRIKIVYDTEFSELGQNGIPHGGFGNYGWDSSSIGISIGYRFFGVK